MKILVVSPVCPDAVDSLSRQHDVICAFNAPQDEIKARIVDCDILVFRSGPDITAAVMDCAPNLSLLIRAGSGLDNLDLEHAVSRGIALARIERPGARAVAELSFSFMLALARQVPKADALLRLGHWVKHELTGYLLSGKTLGIYGVGNIGLQVGQMGAAWGMQVIGCVEHHSENRAVELQNQGIQLVDTNEVLSSADFLSVHLPLQQ